MAGQRRTAGALAPMLLLGLCVSVAIWNLTSRGFVSVASPRLNAKSVVAMRALDFGQMDELTKDPEKMKAVQAEAEKMMADPTKKSMVDSFSTQMEGIVKKLEADPDPELQAFFKDIKANGMEAMKRYENNPTVLQKFAEASGGPEGLPLPNMDAMGGAPPPTGGPHSFKIGDLVIVHGLAKAPEHNGQKAMVVPPTAEEKKTLEGTGRLIVRLVDDGQQFALKPENIRTMAEEASRAIENSLEDVSLQNPALQNEAAKLRDSGKLDSLQNDPELKPIFEDIKKNGMAALEKYWNDDELMKKINAAMTMR